MEYGFMQACFFEILPIRQVWGIEQVDYNLSCL